MFKRKYKKRSISLPFVIFRMLLSLIIFGVLVAGGYSALEHFSGVNLMKVEPQAVLGMISAQLPQLVNLKLPTENLLPSSPNVAGLSATPSPTLAEPKSPEPSSTPKYNSFEFILVADSHNDNDNLAKALSVAKREKARLVIGLGDYTDVGTLGELQKAKREFDQAGVRYFVIPGDHDLWDSRDKQKSPTEDFVATFGPTYQAFTEEGVRFLLVFNSDNYLGLGKEQLSWLNGELEAIKKDPPRLSLVMLHEPLYHPSSIRIMGKVEGKLKSEAKDLINKFKDAGVKEVFAGDIHYFTQYSEPDSGLHMTTAGALTSQRNAEAPRFVRVKVYPDNHYSVEDVEVTP